MTQSPEHNGTAQGNADCPEPVVFFSNPLMSDVESDWSPIHDAAYNGHVLSLRSLVAQGANVNLSTLDLVSPLFGACLKGHTVCAKLLLDNGANVNSSTLDRRTPLFVACAQGHKACVTLLLQHGAAPQGTSSSNSSIHIAAAKGHPECIDALVQHGADVDQHIDQLGSPLHAACINLHVSTVRKLLLLGACMNSGRDSESPLHTAARLSNPELVTALLEHGADRSIRNHQDKLPLDLAPPNSPIEKLLGHRGVSRLMQLCRLYIRKVLSKQRLGDIHGLPIPSELKQYLLYQSELWGAALQ
ncbi:ankyrin repeat and SOCS box protein 9-like isoform 2-T2 [Aplochiton taeniatus]